MVGRVIMLLVHLILLSAFGLPSYTYTCGYSAKPVDSPTETYTSWDPKTRVQRHHVMVPFGGYE